MTNSAESKTAGTALVVCKHPETRQLIIEALQPLAIRTEICEELFMAAGLLDKGKFEAVIVDMLLGEEAVLLLDLLRFSPSNQTAVTFAVMAEGGSRSSAKKSSSTFVLQRPLSRASVNQTLRAAYGLIARERRRYFRCPIGVPAFIRARQPEELLCQTVNVSEGGLAISVPATPEPIVPSAVRFGLPERSSQLSAATKMCWRGKDGLVGLEFQSMAAPQKSELQEWLARKLDETLPDNVAALFRTVGQS